jgi:hypothetical protein
MFIAMYNPADYELLSDGVVLLLSGLLFIPSLVLASVAAYCATFLRRRAQRAIQPAILWLMVVLAPYALLYGALAAGLSEGLPERTPGASIGPAVGYGVASLVFYGSLLLLSLWQVSRFGSLGKPDESSAGTLAWIGVVILILVGLDVYTTLIQYEWILMPDGPGRFAFMIAFGAAGMTHLLAAE